MEIKRTHHNIYWKWATFTLFNLQSDEYIGLEHSPEDNEKDELSESSESESEDEIEDLGSDFVS